MIHTIIKRDGEIDTSRRSFQALCPLPRTTLKKSDSDFTLKASHTPHSQLHVPTTSVLICTDADQQQLIVRTVVTLPACTY
jgi:hypothetical protein